MERTGTILKDWGCRVGINVLIYDWKFSAGVRTVTEIVRIVGAFVRTIDTTVRTIKTKCAPFTPSLLLLHTIPAQNPKLLLEYYLYLNEIYIQPK